jgi:sporulation protein YlmC with PRC-barrel domain
MKSLRLAAAVLAFVAPFPEDASAAAAGVIIGRAIQDLGGRKVGTVEDLIVDVREGRVLYVIVDARERYLTLPIHALREGADGVRLDMEEKGEIAKIEEPRDDPRFRRAARLIGQALVNPGGGRIGTIAEIEFDPSAGRVERVVVDVDNGKANFPPSVLAHGRFPPLTRWQAENPPSEFSGDPGFVRRAPSPERERLHDHRWPRN